MPLTSPFPVQNIVDDDMEIQYILSVFAQGWNAHDVQRFSSVFAEDADFTNVLGVGRHGRASIEALHEPLFKTIWSKSTMTITDTKTRFIKPDVAVVDAHWILTGLLNPAGESRPSRNGLLNFVMTNSNGNWKILVMHNMDLPGSSAQNC